ncbi:MAG: cytoplasmic protein [Proteobacteria bacterium]|nr:cytoplasmic protein [Pseudomonadota bacterium]
MPEKPRPDFQGLEASSLFCPKCRKAVPVRKRLLLILPEGEKFDYVCSFCSSPIGSKLEKERDQSP